ncbi:MAG: response regulator [Chloroflexi bacterium]|nr:response regulator [Chloroflexota bacterium]
MNSSIADTEMLIAGDILIVDDTPANLRLLSGMLGEQGYKVRLAPNGKLALMNAQAAPPDLILLDIKMPGLSGYEVCEQLKADPRTRNIPVIFISALDQTEDKVKAFTLGGVDYVTKPLQVEEVLARVETHLKLRELQKQLTERVRELEEALAKVKKLEGLLPICSYCKRVRDDQDYWHRVESYIEARSEALFSHGICPDCYKEHVTPQLEALRRRRKQDEI